MGVLHAGQQIEEQADFGKMFKNGGLTQRFPFEPITCRSLRHRRVLDVNTICSLLSPETVRSRAAWADNADACAKQYAGTGALKTDFTRSVFRDNQ